MLLKHKQNHWFNSTNVLPSASGEVPSSYECFFELKLQHAFLKIRLPELHIINRQSLPFTSKVGQIGPAVQLGKKKKHTQTHTARKVDG